MFASLFLIRVLWNLARMPEHLWLPQRVVCDEKVRKSNNRNFTFDSRLVYSFIQHVATKVTVGQRGMYQKNMTFREIKV